MTVTPEPSATAIEFIATLDLEPIVFKLTNPDEGETGMTLAEADEGVRLYRAFLTLMALYPDRQLVPTPLIDKVWHAHMLDSLKYFDDCDYVFGRYIHHFPYFGLRGADDAAALKVAGAETRSLLREILGTDAVMSGSTICAAATCDPGPNQSCSGKCTNHDGKAMARPRPDRSVAQEQYGPGRRDARIKGRVYAS